MSRESRLSFKNQGFAQTLQALVWSELCFAKWLRHRILVKAFCYAKRSSTAPFSSGCILCGSLVRTLLCKVATPPHHIQNFASKAVCDRIIFRTLLRKRSATAASFFAVHWSKHFATQNGLRPPRFLRGAYFAVHKRQRSSLFLTAPFFFGVHTLRFIVQNFASQSGYATASIFAVHKRLDLNFEQPYCQYFAI